MCIQLPQFSHCVFKIYVLLCLSRQWLRDIYHFVYECKSDVIILIIQSVLLF